MAVWLARVCSSLKLLRKRGARRRRARSFTDPRAASDLAARRAFRFCALPRLEAVYATQIRAFPTPSAQYAASLSGDDARPFWAVSRWRSSWPPTPTARPTRRQRCHLHRAWAVREEDAVARRRAIDERDAARRARRPRGAWRARRRADRRRRRAARARVAALLGGGDAAVRASLAPGRRLQLRANGALAEEARAADARPLPAPPFVALAPPPTWSASAPCAGKCLCGCRCRCGSTRRAPPPSSSAARVRDFAHARYHRRRRDGAAAAAVDGATPPELEEVEAELPLWNEQVELLPLLLTPPGRPVLLGAVAVSAGSAEVGLDGVPGALPSWSFALTRSSPSPSRRPTPPSRRRQPPPPAAAGRRRPPASRPPPPCCCPPAPPSPSARRNSRDAEQARPRRTRRQRRQRLLTVGRRQRRGGDVLLRAGEDGGGQPGAAAARALRRPPRHHAADGAARPERPMAAKLLEGDIGEGGAARLINSSTLRALAALAVLRAPRTSPRCPTHRA